MGRGCQQRWPSPSDPQRTSCQEGRSLARPLRQRVVLACACESPCPRQRQGQAVEDAPAFSGLEPDREVLGMAEEAASLDGLEGLEGKAKIVGQVCLPCSSPRCLPKCKSAASRSVLRSRLEKSLPQSCPQEGRCLWQVTRQLCRQCVACVLLMLSD